MGALYLESLVEDGWDLIIWNAQTTPTCLSYVNKALFYLETAAKLNPSDV